MIKMIKIIPNFPAGIYYSPVTRSEDYDGIYEDISEAGRLSSGLVKESEMRSVLKLRSVESIPSNR